MAPGEHGRTGRRRRADLDSQQRAARRRQPVHQQWHQRLLQPAAQCARWRARSRRRCSAGLGLRDLGVGRGRPGAGARYLDALHAHGGAVHDRCPIRRSRCGPRRASDSTPRRCSTGSGGTSPTVPATSRARVGRLGGGVSYSESRPVARQVTATGLSPKARMRIPPMVAPGSRLMVLAVALIAASAAPRRLQAQAPNERAELERFRDSLARPPDSIGLLALEQRMIDAAKADRNDTLRPSQAGLPVAAAGRPRRPGALRRRRLRVPVGHRPAAHVALRVVRHGAGRIRRRRFPGLVRHRAQDHARQGRAHAVGDGVRQVGRSGPQLRARAGGAVEYRAPAARQYQARRRARRAPPRGHAPRPAPIPRCCSRAGGWSARWATATPPSPPSAAISTGARTGASASSRSPARCSCSGASTASQPYYEGAASRRLRRPSPDTGLTSPRSPRTACSREFDRCTGASGRHTCRQFWTERDRAELRGEGERLREHYRRLFYARKNFQLTSLNRHYDIVERYRSGSRDFDDRGIIYIRHGEPTTRATYAAPGLEPNESWRYTRPEGDLHLPLRGARGRAGLQAGREPVRRARLQPGDRACAATGPATTRWPSSSCSRGRSCRRSTSGSSRPAPSAAGSTSRRSAGWARRASRSVPRPTATSSTSPRISPCAATCSPWATTPAARWCRSPTPSRARASSR